MARRGLPVWLAVPPCQVWELMMARLPAGPVMLNLAVGGVWAGADGIDLKGFPTSFDIDHVRVYEVRSR